VILLEVIFLIHPKEAGDAFRAAFQGRNLCRKERSIFLPSSTAPL